MKLSEWSFGQYDNYRRKTSGYAHEWEEAGGIPRELHAKAAAIGMFGLNFPEEHGGEPADPFFISILHQELARSGAGGIYSALLSFTIASFPVARMGSEELKRKMLPGVFRSLVHTFNDERLGLATSSISYAHVTYEEAFAYAKLRSTFGKPHGVVSDDQPDAREGRLAHCGATDAKL
jgi:alkylation response protein AidB-like acyl-CoA dehydrogenase